MKWKHIIEPRIQPHSSILSALLVTEIAEGVAERLLHLQRDVRKFIWP